MLRRHSLLPLLPILVLAAGCGRTAAKPAVLVPSPRLPSSQLPPLGPANLYVDGTLVHEQTLRSTRGESYARIYLPNPMPPGKVPCVFIAPAGSPLVFGMKLTPHGEGDEKEHYPYALAGFVVVAYSIDGHVSGKSDADVATGVKAFRRANAGVENAREAIDFALARLPNIDPKRLYVAGHSSAGTLALQVAQHEPRIAACAAFAPATDFEARMGGQLGSLDAAQPGTADFLRSMSPLVNAGKLRCPLFLFHADDDSNVSTADNAKFAEVVGKTNPKVKFVRVPTGDHYDSMIQQGIPQAIAWFKSLPN